MSLIAVVGATGRTGSAVTSALTRMGHDVVAVSRTAPPEATVAHRPTDVLDHRAVSRALTGADAVVVALGISENPLSVRLRGARQTSSQVRSAGTRHVIRAMEEQGIRRLVVLSSFGVAESFSSLSLQMKLIIGGLLRPQFRDHELQEEIVRASALDWTLARPVNLLDEDRGPLCADPHMRTVSMSVGREQVADRLADWATTSAAVRETVALSS